MQTISFNEKVKGWTSFHSLNPDLMLGLNNQFFTLKGGDLYIHHSDVVDTNTYYGIKYSSKLSLVFNQSPSDIKEVKALSLEGDKSWDVSAYAYISSSDETINSTIKSSEFVKKEGIWYGYARRNENDYQLDSKSAFGVGVITTIATVGTDKIITVNGYNPLLVDGDKLMNGSNTSVVHNILKVEYVNGLTKVYVDNYTGFNTSDFVVGVKNSRIEGGNLRGYVIRLDMEDITSGETELFAVNADVMKSFP